LISCFVAVVAVVLVVVFLVVVVAVVVWRHCCSAAMEGPESQSASAVPSMSRVADVEALRVLVDEATLALKAQAAEASAMVMQQTEVLARDAARRKALIERQFQVERLHQETEDRKARLEERAAQAQRRATELAAPAAQAKAEDAEDAKEALEVEQLKQELELRSARHRQKTTEKAAMRAAQEKAPQAPLVAAFGLGSEDGDTEGAEEALEDAPDALNHWFADTGIFENVNVEFSPRSASAADPFKNVEFSPKAVPPREIEV